MAGRMVRIKTESIVMEAEFNNSRTAAMIWDALPITSPANKWGDEIYFTTPVDARLDNGVIIVELGDLAYWPPGRAFCIFSGPTPMSQGDEIRSATAVNVIGKLLGDATVFKQVKNWERVTVEQFHGR